MKFDINKYRGHYVMHCKTEEEANDFCMHLHECGRSWDQEQSYFEETNWDRHKEDTVYYFNEGLFGMLYHAKRQDYTILEWEDFMNDTFTKANLKTSDVVKFRNDKVGIVNRALGIIITQTGYIDMLYINNDMTNGLVSKEFDIIAVRRPNVKGDCQFIAFDNNFGALVYEREKVEEMTLAEICKLLGKNIKIIK